ncbi:hypothetical protein HK104_000579 [Borealophlyctis nickersoniae]|nr:hypothetical protein HK104_000579 [Borealophlyctis nickersoniae]
MAEKDILEFLRHRGRDLEYFVFLPAPNSRLAPLIKVLPNSDHRTEDVIAFINNADKVENLFIRNLNNIPQEIHDVAIARGVKLVSGGFPPRYAVLKDESLMGL